MGAMGAIIVLKAGYRLLTTIVYRVECPHCGRLDAVDMDYETAYNRATLHAREHKETAFEPVTDDDRTVL